MEHFVTLFDSLFLPQGLALHASMQRKLPNYRLWVLCVDDLAHDLLTKLALPNVSLIRLSSVETPELLAVKPGRGKGEYCWTLTPFAPRFQRGASRGSRGPRDRAADRRSRRRGGRRPRCLAARRSDRRR